METIVGMLAFFGIPSGLIALFFSLLWLFGVDVPSGSIAIFGAISITCMVPVVAVIAFMWWLERDGEPRYPHNGFIASPPPPPKSRFGEPSSRQKASPPVTL